MHYPILLLLFLISGMYSMPNDIFEKPFSGPFSFKVPRRFLETGWLNSRAFFLKTNAPLTLLLLVSNATGFGIGILGRFYQKKKKTQ